jgi:hypothetical protein
MPKYKLSIPSPGEYIYCEGDMVYVGDTAAEAHEFYIEEACEEGPEFWVFPEILRGRCVYARDIDNCDCHEDAEPGDTTFDYVARGESALRPLNPGEILTWPRGTWRPFWTYGPTRYGRPPARAPRRLGPRFMGEVGADVLGDDFPTREAARDAVDREVTKRIDAWKAAHPEYRCLTTTSDE